MTRILSVLKLTIIKYEIYNKFLICSVNSGENGMKLTDVVSEDKTTIKTKIRYLFYLCSQRSVLFIFLHRSIKMSMKI